MLCHLSLVRTFKAFSRQSTSLTCQRSFHSFTSHFIPRLRVQAPKFFQYNHAQSHRIFRAFRLVGLSFGSGCILVRNALCKNVTRRTNLPQSGELKTQEPQLTWTQLWLLIRPYFHWLLAAAVGAILAAILNIQIPILLGDLINVIANFIKNNSIPDLSQINPIAGHLLVLYAGQAFFTFFYITCLSIMGERIASDLRVRLFEHLLHFDMTFYDQQKTGELSDRLNFDIQEFKSCFKACVAQGLRTTAQTAGCIVSLYFISPTMTALTVAIIPVIISVGTIFGILLRHISMTAQNQNMLASGVAAEAFQNISTVKAFAMEDAERNLYHQEIEKARVLNERLGAGIGAFQAATNIFLNGIVLGILYGGARLMVDSSISPGDLMSFLVTSQTIQRSLTQLSLVFGNAIKGWTACARIHEFLQICPSNTQGFYQIPYHSFIGNISFEDVSFTYTNRPNHQVLHGLSLKINSGQTVALCGPSGSGKSTIAAILERLYEPQSGIITIDGNNLRDLDPYWLRRNVIGIISQEPVLFATTLEENIRYGKTDATDDEIREAARLANADSFIEHFPHGYKTVVGERGVTLSGGQKQRIAIARALLKNPPILILDEATSALDAESERMVQLALENAMQNRTVIIIAHRLSTIRNADMICVIKEGKVIEQGKHLDLLRKKGAYYDLVNMQHNGSS
ncbi:ABC transporter transmembrane region domain-containing protein [Ditylenchus destructor]|nr:ABC transporter transmembrane region domain-containing protein [Ditylenchus destructor]